MARRTRRERGESLSPAGPGARRRGARLGVAAVLGGALVLSPGAGAETTVPATRVTDALTDPVFAASPPDDPRLFVLEREGLVRILDPATEQIADTPFLDLRARVNSSFGESGLLGLAFDPSWDRNGYLYVYYTAHGPPGGGPLTSVLARFTAEGDPGEATQAESERELFTLEQPRANHNGGTVGFGPDGLLYLGLGDGGGVGDPEDRAQDDGVLFGKLLRFGVAPPLPEGEELVPVVVAGGLRNPYRFSFDARDGHLYLGDVGQGSREEIDVLRKGELQGFEPGDTPFDFGWNTMEGSACFEPADEGEPECGSDALRPPIHEYAHTASNGRCSVTGGVVYRGSAMPSLRGRYLFGDFCTGELWTLEHDPAGAPPESSLESERLSLEPDAGSLDFPVAFAEGPARELYGVDRDGELFRLPEPGAGATGAAALATLAALAHGRRRTIASPRAGARG